MVAFSMASKPGSEIDSAISRMLAAYAGNSWFLEEHWPVNEPRIRNFAKDLVSLLPGRGRLLDIGCFNGYVSVLCSELGFQPTACDAHSLPDQEELFRERQIPFVQANLNERNALARIPSETFDVVVMGEILEHVLNHPVGVLREVCRVLRPGGFLLLTTPNPSNVMNAARLLLDRSILWGTDKFASVPKIEGAGAICEADIHYREYTAEALMQMILESGLKVTRREFVSFGSARGENRIKTLFKKTPGLRQISHKRLLASTHYVVARKP